MLNEYTYILIESACSILCLLIAFSYLNKNRQYNWIYLGKKCLYFIWLMICSVLYILETYENEYLLRYSLFMISIMIVFILILILMVINFIFGIFLERKHKRRHLLLNYVEYLSSLNILRIQEMLNILEACTCFSSLFSISSMFISFIISYILNMQMLKPNIYLLEVGPYFILLFMVISFSLQVCFIFTLLVYFKCCKVHVKDEDEINVIAYLNNEKKKMKW